MRDLKAKQYPFFAISTHASGNSSTHSEKYITLCSHFNSKNKKVGESYYSDKRLPGLQDSFEINCHRFFLAFSQLSQLLNEYQFQSQTQGILFTEAKNTILLVLCSSHHGRLG